MTAADLPKISIIMPILNCVDTIEKAIVSVIDQHYPNLELIVMDGGSNDGTVEIIRKYEQHIDYWRSGPDGNPVNAYNSGIEKATGDLIAILMGDDWYEPNTLHKIGAALLKNPDADMVSCAGRIVYYDEKKQCYVPHLIYKTAKDLDLNLYNVCFAISVICCRFIRKSLYERIGLYIPYNAAGRYVFSNDKEFLMRAILNNAKNIFVDHMGHNYLAHKGSSTFGNNQANIMRLCEEHMETAENYLQKEKLSSKNRFLLRYWYNDNSTRLLLYKLLANDPKAALKTAKEGIQKYNVFWFFAFTYTTAKIISKKSLRALRKLYPQAATESVSAK